jgi:tetratricopeptide (TPR) repeat protein
MKVIKVVCHPLNARAVPIGWVLPGLILAMLTLAVVLFSGTGIGIALASNALNVSAADGQAQSSYVSEEEENAYRDAKREPDVRKRAEKLYAYAQKYPKSALLQLADFDEIKPIEEEYSAYYAASQEPDFEKHAAMQIDFLQRFPKSALVGNVENEFMKLLSESAQAKKYELLDSLAEKWLRLRPNDSQAYAFIAEANINLKRYQRAGESLEALYKLHPSPAVAREIISAYENSGNMEKLVEWGEKLFKMPELADDYMLRYDYMMQFFKRNDLAKAAEYARLTLKSAELAKPKDEAAKEQLDKVHRACHNVIASDLLEKGNYAEAISVYEEAIKDHKYSEGYYRIGQILDKQKDIEKAAQYYAMAELIGGADAGKAKARLEVLYKALHNDTLIGIDKVYKRAKEALAESESKS